MRQAVADDRLQFARHVATQGIAHLDRRRQLRCAHGQHVLEVLAGVFASAEEQGDPAAFLVDTMPEVNIPRRSDRRLFAASTSPPPPRRLVSSPADLFFACLAAIAHQG